MAEQSGRAGSEIDRLRQELTASRQRLEDEVNYYRAQVEVGRKRMEAEHVRLQASEVARRRKLEDEMAVLQTRLHDALQHSERLQRRYDELSEQFLRQEASSRDSVEEQVRRYQAAAREAWRSAEEEVERMERELSEARGAQQKEQARRQEIEETLRSLQEMGSDSEDRQADLEEELSAVKQALNLSERARVQTQRRAVMLGEKLVEVQANLDGLAQKAAAADKAATASELPKKGPFSGLSNGAGNPTEVDLSRANEVLKSVSANKDDIDQGESMTFESAAGSAELELADEFMVISADASLDRAKVNRLREQVEQAELQESTQRLAQKQAAREHDLMRESASPHPPASRKPGPVRAVPESPGSQHRSRGIGVITTVAVLLLAGAGGWLLGLLP